MEREVRTSMNRRDVFKAAAALVLCPEVLIRETHNVWQSVEWQIDKQGGILWITRGSFQIQDRVATGLRVPLLRGYQRISVCYWFDDTGLTGNYEITDRSRV